MQKDGVTKGSEFQPESSGIARDLRGLHEGTLRSAIAEAVRRHKPLENVQLPKKEDVEQSIDAVFVFSKLAQPSAKLNAGAGIVDLTSLYFAASSLSIHSLPAAVAGGICTIASETVSRVKNFTDNRHYSKLRKKELSFLKQCKSDITSVLESKLAHAADEAKRREIKNLIKETEKLYKRVERESKENLETARGTKLLGFGSSGLVAFLNTYMPPFTWVANGVSDFFQSVARVQPFQFQPYNPPLAIIGLAAKTALLVVESVIVAGVAYEAYKDRFEDSITKRQNAQKELKLRVDWLFGKIQEV